MPDNSAYANTQPEQAMSFQDYWNSNAVLGRGESPYSLGNQFLNWQTGSVNSLKDEYNAYLQNLNTRNEYAATQSARAWDEYMSSTQYQRAVKDLEAAGLNPYLLISQGSVQPASVSSAAKSSYDSYKSSGKDKNSNAELGRNAALILLAAARFVAALI